MLADLLLTKQIKTTSFMLMWFLFTPISSPLYSLHGRSQGACFSSRASEMASHTLYRPNQARLTLSPCPVGGGATVPSSMILAKRHRIYMPMYTSGGEPAQRWGAEHLASRFVPRGGNSAIPNPNSFIVLKQFNLSLTWLTAYYLSGQYLTMCKCKICNFFLYD